MLLNRFLAAAAGAVALVSGTASLAQDDFYAGKTIEVIVPASAGGSYGMYGQLVADEMGKYIPGNPTIVPNFMRGAGGMRASNYVGNVAASDGTVLFMMHQNTPTSQLLSPDAAQYDAATFQPIGTLSAMNSVMVMRKDQGIDDVGEMGDKEIVTGSTGRGSYQYIVPTLMNEFADTNFNVVTTYGGTGETRLALERGEIGALMTSIISLQSSTPDWADGTGIAKVVMQVGMAPSSSYPDVPMLSSYAKDDRQAAIYKFLSASNGFARSMVAPAGVPEEQMAILRQAFLDMVQDEAFQARAKELGMPLDWSDADELGAAIQDVLATDPEILAFTQEVMAE